MTTRLATRLQSFHNGRFCQTRAFHSSRVMAHRYEDAIAALNTLQTNHSVIEKIRKSRGSLNAQAIPEMIEWLRRIGYKPADLDAFRPLHVAGTKGKGSTCAFLSSILQQYPQLQKVGVYTSPHLRSVRERIKINNAPITEPLFARYLYEVWDRLETSAQAEGRDPAEKPVYFRFLTLVAMHTYLSEKVDAAVLEVGIGGEYDSTNIVEHPTCTGITSLALDHINILGDTVAKIAWHKAGIFKAGSPAFSTLQPDEAMAVVKERAREKGVELAVVDSHSALEDFALGIQGDIQKLNASLAIAMASSHLAQVGVPHTLTANELPVEFVTGLQKASLSGRCEKRTDGAVTWYLDGGHTAESVALATKWYSAQASSTKVLIFNQQSRDAPALLRTLHSLTVPGFFSLVIFTTNVTYAKGGYKADLASLNVDPARVTDLTVQRDLAKTWTALEPAAQVEVVATLEEAVKLVKDEGDGVDCFVTGSLHLVGGVMEVLDLPVR